MKNRIILSFFALTTALVATLSLTACQANMPSTTTETSTESSADEADEASKDNKIYTFEREIDIEGEVAKAITYVERITLELQDDKNATLTDSTIYNDNCYAETVYSGLYTLEDPGIIFKYENDDDTPSSVDYWFTLDADGNVTDASQVYADEEIISVAGTYTEKDDPFFGDLTLTVNRDGSAILSYAGANDLIGSLIRYENEYDLMVTNDEMSLDWYIYFDGDTFTHQEFYNKSYSEYEGTLTITGDLGDIELVIAQDGSVTTEVPINGNVYNMYGSIGVDYETETLDSLYLYSYDDLYSLSLTLVLIDDGTWNYSGSLTTPLSAG